MRKWMSVSFGTLCLCPSGKPFVCCSLWFTILWWNPSATYESLRQCICYVVHTLKPWKYGQEPSRKLVNILDANSSFLQLKYIIFIYLWPRGNLCTTCFKNQWLCIFSYEFRTILSVNRNLLLKRHKQVDLGNDVLFSLRYELNH
jgi:hypothetical protein